MPQSCGEFENAGPDRQGIKVRKCTPLVAFQQNLFRRSLISADMTQMYRLYYAPDNASLIIRLALHALAVPYQTVLVDRSVQGQKAPDYLAINPNGLIPALETPHGAIFETGAILLWLADTHGALEPAPDDPDRAAFLKWLFFVSNTLHPALRMLFYPSQYVGSEPAVQDALRAQMNSEVARHFQTLNAAAGAGHPWFNGATPSGLDYYVAACLRWVALYPDQAVRHDFDLPRYQNLMTLLHRIEKRPEARAVQTAEGLGPTPFTAPHHPTPQDGSAT
ncbi:hypothetical protein SuNHUV7_00790 (plasmid) [Pseudoseohaeicola sp. NH-UV-7]